MKRWMIVVAAFAILIIVTGGYLWKGTGSPPGQTSNQTQRIVTVRRGDLQLSVTADGVVQPINLLEVKSKASGQIVELTFEEGQEVKKGDLLMALDPITAQNTYDQAKADLELGEATADQQENNQRRAEELFTKGMMSQQERDQARVDYVKAKSSLIKARAALSSADESLRDTRIHAPITGIILSKNVEMGQIISSGVFNVGGGTLLATLADMQEVYVEASVDEVDIGRVAVGQMVSVTADAYPDEQYQGEVIRIAPQGVTQQNVTVFPVLILVQNKEGRLKAGMSASVNVEVFRKNQVLLLANEALIDPRTEQGKELLAQLGDSGGGRAPAHFAQDSARSSRRGSPGTAATEAAPPTDQSSGGSLNFKKRLVMIKDEQGSHPQEVIIGASNYDESEVLSGLRDGEEIVIQSTSRAQQAQREFSNRMRGMSGMRKPTSP